MLTSAENNAIFKTEMEVLNMVNTNLNIRTDKEVKNQAEKIFNAQGMNMTTAVNIFLKTTIREDGIPSVSLLTFLMQQLDLPLKKANESPLIKK